MTRGSVESVFGEGAQKGDWVACWNAAAITGTCPTATGASRR